MAIIELTSRSFDEHTSGEKMTVVMFYTSTCSVCAAMKPVFDKLSEELGKEATFAMVNAGNNIDLAQRFGIMGVPTFKFLCRGRPIGELVGQVNATILRNTVRDRIKHRTECINKSTPINWDLDGYG